MYAETALFAMGFLKYNLFFRLIHRFSELPFQKLGYVSRASPINFGVVPLAVCRSVQNFFVNWRASTHIITYTFVSHSILHNRFVWLETDECLQHCDGLAFLEYQTP